MVIGLDQLTSLFGKANEDVRGTIISRLENGSCLPVWEKRAHTIDKFYVPVLPVPKEHVSSINTI